MESISKALKLGLIIVAIQLLGKLKVRLPGIVTLAAACLGVSRKAGYAAAERLDKLLRAEEKGKERDLRHEVLILRIRNQMLTFERDHPGFLFSERGRHAPAEARSLCVRILRKFEAELSETEIASILGVPLSNLRRWNAEADRDCQFPPKPDRRGTHSRATAEDARKVVEKFEKLKAEGQSMTLEEFTEEYKKAHPDKPLDRRTITRILQAEGLLQIKTRDSRKSYHDEFQIYHPGAQVAVDAKKIKVSFSANSPESVTVTREFSIDIATSAILGVALRTQEDSEGVQRVLVQASKQCVSMLAVLADNGSANKARGTQAVVERVSAVGQIFSFRYHPQTNGHLEGHFGQFARIVGEIVIDDSSREAIARSVCEAIFRIWEHFHNYSPRKRLGGMGPLEYFRRYSNPPPEKEEEARKGLEKQKERSDARRYPPARLCDPRFRSLVDGVLTRNRIQKPLEKALQALLDYDNRAIESASQAFFSYSHHDGFDESKRNFAYFMGIVKNKQKEIDEDRVRQEVEAQKSRRFQEELRSHERKIDQEKAQEAEDLKKNPEQVVLTYARHLLAGRLRLMRNTWLGKLRKGLEALRKLGRPKRVLEELAVTIRSWVEYPAQLKEKMVEMLYSEYEARRT